jgi:NitT/TauT family transport system substrate-binding protein
MMKPISKAKTGTLAAGLAAALFTAATVLPTGGASAAEKVNFVLNWVAQGDHSPYYYAKSLGWYEQAGIDLEIESGRGTAVAIQKVAVGQNQVGIADFTNVLQARAKDVDVTGIMAIYSNTAFGLYWKKSAGIASPADLAGKKIGSPPGDAVRQIWPAIADAIGVPADSVTWVNIAPEAKVASLQSGVIDFTQHMYSVHDVYETTFGDDLGFVLLKDTKFNPYGLSIIANPAFLKEKPEVAKAFVQVSQKAFLACFKEPEPCTRALAEATSQKPEDVLKNWRRVETLMESETNRTVALGAFDPKHVEADATTIGSIFGIEIPTVDASFTNDLLDKDIRLP